MLSLILSGILVAVAFLAYRQAKNPVVTTIGWAVALPVLPAYLMLMIAFPAVWLQSGILCVGLLIALLLGRSRQALRPLAVISPLVAYAYIGVTGTSDQREYDRLRAVHPFESMEERLPRPVPPSAAGDPKRLERLEQAVGQNSASDREVVLRRIHNDNVSLFVNSPGFGVGRMERVLRDEPRDDAPPQPDYFRPESKDADVLSRRPDRVALDGLHEGSFLDFVNPRGFGYVKDRQHVAGFRSHGFSRVPKPAGGWGVAGLELVGLLQHEKPVVYVSAKLPRMDELKDVPTRPLDAFETAALASLRGGADLHVGDGTDSWRFVGAVRATKQCLGCHGGDRGALLGAFSYRLRPAKE